MALPAFLLEIGGRLLTQNVGVLNVSLGYSSAAIIPATIGQPGGPDSFLVIIDTGGRDSAKTHNNTATERPTAQLKAHAMSFPLAYAQALAAYNALGGANGLHNITLGGTFYLRISARQRPTDMGPDDAKRPTCGFNIEAEKQPS